MDKDYSEKYLEWELHYWWYVARRDLLGHFIRSKESKVLDVGCSGGALLSYLSQRGYKKLYGVDLNEKYVHLCRKKGFDVRISLAEKLPYSDNFFDILVAGDILEHIQSDKAALQEWYRVLKPGGTLFLMVPAFMFLWSHHDEINHHFRRYHKKQLMKLLKKTGWIVKRATYWNVSLFLPVLFLKIIKRILGSKSDDLERVGPLNAFFINLLRLENNLIKRRLDFPVGTSLFILARKSP